MPKAKTEVALQFSESCAAEVALQHSVFCNAEVISTKSCVAASEELQCDIEKAALQGSGAFLLLSCGFQAPTFRHPRFGPADTGANPQNREQTPLFVPPQRITREMLLLNGSNKDKELITPLFKIRRLGLRPLVTSLSHLSGLAATGFSATITKLVGTEKTMTTRDVTGFCTFLSTRKPGKCSPHIGANSLLNYTETLEKQKKSTGEIQKIQWRRCPEIADFCPLSWSNVS